MRRAGTTVGSRALLWPLATGRTRAPSWRTPGMAFELLRHDGLRGARRAKAPVSDGAGCFRTASLAALAPGCLSSKGALRCRKRLKRSDICFLQRLKSSASLSKAACRNGGRAYRTPRVRAHLGPTSPLIGPRGADSGESGRDPAELVPNVWTTSARCGRSGGLWDGWPLSSARRRELQLGAQLVLQQRDCLSSAEWSKSCAAARADPNPQ